MKRGITFANHVCTVSSLVYRYGIDMEYAMVNPFANIKRKTPHHNVRWCGQRTTCVNSLTLPMGSGEWRSLGLIVHMAYEWCQRLGDMRMLQWDNLDMDDRKLYLEQSKRRAEVCLPIEDDLYDMLVQQKEGLWLSSLRGTPCVPVLGVSTTRIV